LCRRFGTLFQNVGAENSTRRRITQKKEYNKGTEVQHAELGTASPLMEWLKYYSSKLHEDDRQRVTMLCQNIARMSGETNFGLLFRDSSVRHLNAERMVTSWLKNLLG
jgi:hypothetical protein